MALFLLPMVMDSRPVLKPGYREIESCGPLRQQRAAAMMVTEGCGLRGDDGRRDRGHKRVTQSAEFSHISFLKRVIDSLAEITTSFQKMSVQHRCSRCGGTNIYRLPRSGVIDKILGVLKLRPYRCLRCYVRFYSPVSWSNMNGGRRP